MTEERSASTTTTPDGAPPEAEAIEESFGAPTPARRRRSRRGGRGRGRGRRTTSATGDRTSEPIEPGAEVADTPEPDDAVEGLETGDALAPKRRRRRRGGRGRSKKTTTTLGEGEAAAAGSVATEPLVAELVEGEPTAKAPARRRRAAPKAPEEAAPSTRRRRTTRPTETAIAPEGEISTTPAPPVSTRLTRPRATRTIRGTRRRREPVVAPPRVTDKLMVITEHGERDQIAVLEERNLVQHYVTRAGAHSMVGNVYLGRVQNVLPGMEAAFVDVGRGRNAVLYAGEVNWSVEDLEGTPPRIEHALRPGQSVLVQVTKDPIGGKGARLTAQVSLPGRYLVLAPSSNVTGISRRLPDEERKRLKAISKKIRPDGHGLIVRTAAEGASEEALAADAERLLATWKDIEKRSKRAKAPAILYGEPELTVRVVRDLFTDEEFRELVTDSSRVYGLVTDYLSDVAPDLLAKVRLHQGKLPVFEEFHVVEQIHKGLDRKVWLPSGGYLVIDRTEAMTVIDVNTGKSVGKTNLEETVVNTNVEAAVEVARQLRLRDIGGMIIIDFIDMLLEQNKKKVIATLEEALAQDKSRSQVFDISPLGLLEVTRKRVSGGLLEAFSETCPTCEGRGVILTYDVS
jgi:ribonuclease E